MAEAGGNNRNRQVKHYACYVVVSPVISYFALAKNSEMETKKVSISMASNPRKDAYKKYSLKKRFGG
jgi:hypothetical protein